MSIFKRKPKKVFTKCNAQWKEKRIGTDGKWAVYTRYCSKNKGHTGRHN